MKFELILAVDSGDGQITNVPLAQMTRPDVSELATLGLRLSESKQLLAQPSKSSPDGYWPTTARRAAWALCAPSISTRVHEYSEPLPNRARPAIT
jgi:hypothetical protein